MVDGIIDVETTDGTRRTRDKAIGTSQDNGGAIIIIGKARGHDANDATVPFCVEDHGALGIFQLLVGSNHIQGFLGDAVVELTAFIIQIIDGSGQFFCVFFLVGDEQTH